jgi:hypothetical protein
LSSQSGALPERAKLVTLDHGKPTQWQMSDHLGRMFMAVIKVCDLAYARLQSPDLDAQEEILTAFGMVRAARTPTALYMRGTDPAHHIHVTERGDPKFIGFAWAVSNEDDLAAISKLPGARRMSRPSMSPAAASGSA